MTAPSTMQQRSDEVSLGGRSGANDHRHLLQPDLGRPDDRHVAAGRVPPQASPVHQGRGRRHRGGAGRRGRAGHRGDPRRRPGRLELQLRLLQDPRAGADQARRRNGQRGQDRLPDAAGRGHQGGHQGGPEQRWLDLPDRHPLHRGRRVDPALRAGPRAGPGDRRVPDDGPHHSAGEAGRAGPHHGRRRLPVRLRRRLRRRPGARRRRRPGSGAGRRTRRRRPGRLPRAREPRPGRGQLGGGRARRRQADRRQRAAASAPARATRRSRP